MTVVRRHFRCFRKVIMTTRFGNPMLAARLVDANETVDAVAFGTDVAALASRFEPGDVVRVVGEPGEFRGHPQIRLGAIKRVATAPPAEIVPTLSRRDGDVFAGFAEHLLTAESAGRFGRLAEELFTSRQLRAAWETAPATTFSHHAYVGGLLEHSVSVAVIAAELCSVHVGLDGELLVAAALLHDLGRARVYPRDDRWAPAGREPRSETLRLIGRAARAVRLGDRELRGLRECIAFCVGDDPDESAPSLEAVALRYANRLDSAVAHAKPRMASNAGVQWRGATVA